MEEGGPGGSRGGDAARQQLGEVGWLPMAEGANRNGTVTGLCLDKTQQWMFGAHEDSDAIFVWDLTAALKSPVSAHNDPGFLDRIAERSKGLCLSFSHASQGQGRSAKQKQQGPAATAICACPQNANLVVTGHKVTRTIPATIFGQYCVSVLLQSCILSCMSNYIQHHCRGGYCCNPLISR